jgi:iron complex outermembrane receptor protein
MEYKLLNAGLNHQFVINKKSLNIGITVNNILNEVYTDHISILRAFNVTHPGRNILANVTLSF